MRLLMTALLASLAAACSQPAAPGPWQLDEDRSTLAFVSIKSGDIAEAHRFSDLAGTVMPDGEAELVIGLASVETGIDIRNERMREHLFETGRFDSARVTTTLDLAAFADLGPGERHTLMLDAILNLHGVAMRIEAEVTVTDIDGQTVLVESHAPVLIHAADHDLTDGLATLQDLAGLPSITPVVPVTFSLVFTRN
ncbi:YceI family protein [Maricaulis sp.]|uniref:YceI family protein n=1 Tax=Maricaulis sp. TaxID=1486257 RepID=UPI002B275418|nr:YceI family protein [Maricaulis sp.]